jgi:hypothetical protein
VDERELIESCINGERVRECSHCHAHSACGGNCCFGLRHEYNDEDCNACALSRECAAITHHIPQGDPRASRRIVYPNQPVMNPVYAQVPTRVSAVPSPYNNRPNPPLIQSQPRSADPIKLDPQAGMLKHFAVIGFWGALEGFFSSILDYLRVRRPQ